jgi:Zn-dependent metalloprotease
MNNYNTKRSRASNLVRLFAILLVGLSFLATTLVNPHVQAAAPVTSAAHNSAPESGDAGFLPPDMVARAALYAQMHSLELIANPVAPAGSTAMPADTPVPPSTQKSLVLIYDARAGRDLPGWRARFESADAVADPTVNRAYELHKEMRAFLKKVFGRDSIDDRGMDLVGTVHYGWRFNNARWNGRQMLYGDGDGVFFLTFVLPDVVGHEVFHGITAQTSQLEYHGQSGALNEHLSDVFGVLLRQWMDNVRADQDNWLVGPGLFTGRMNGRALRDMRYPGTAFNDGFFGKDQQVAHMKDFVHTEEDDGGVHSNSGIPNRAFALFAIAVGGKAWKVPGHIWYETATGGHIPSDCDFQTFAQATVAVCNRQAPSQVEKLKSAWAAVGIYVS